MPKITRRTVLQTAAAATLIPGAALAAKTHKVSIKGNAFSPAKLKIAVGDTITWTNRDSAKHTATANDKAWDTGILKKNKSGSITFSSKGEMGYFCTVHPSMKGKIVVS